MSNEFLLFAALLQSGLIMAIAWYVCSAKPWSH